LFYTIFFNQSPDFIGQHNNVMNVIVHPEGFLGGGHAGSHRSGNGSLALPQNRFLGRIVDILESVF